MRYGQIDEFGVSIFCVLQNFGGFVKFWKGGFFA
jgi:hypothetical protein